tara:strand:- start:1043 stop:1189 length:147 start_codon:yes stop_codon:yes gene_type:complete
MDGLIIFMEVKSELTREVMLGEISLTKGNEYDTMHLTSTLKVYYGISN